MAIDTMDKISAALWGGQKKDFYKVSQTSEGAGTWHSLWKAAQNPPAGVNPGVLVGVIPTDGTLGAFPFNNYLQSKIMQLIASGSTSGKLIFYDRVYHNSEMSGTVISDTSLGTVPDLTRPDALGVGIEMWGEIYTAIGATAATLNVKYTNQDGTTGKNATYSHPANAESVGQMFPLILAAGDTGVRKPTSYNWSVTTGTAGNFGITLLRRICEIPLETKGQIYSFADLGQSKIYDDACIAMMVLCTATNTGNIQGSFTIGQG